ncbi:MAG: hypothetical protein ACK45I_00160 [Bacteroidota bacterium]|jgi:hypothetical protein
MYTLLLMVFSVFVSPAGTTTTPDKAREAYEKSIHDSKAGESFLNETRDVQKLTPLLKAYRGAVLMIMASHYFNPWSKLNSFNSGKELLESAISERSTDAELRYLRFAIQTNSPAFLGYNTHITTDKEFLLTNVARIDAAQVRQKIVSYLRASKHLTDAEKQRLNSI